MITFFLSIKIIAIFSVLVLATSSVACKGSYLGSVIPAIIYYGCCFYRGKDTVDDSSGVCATVRSIFASIYVSLFAIAAPGHVHFDTIGVDADPVVLSPPSARLEARAMAAELPNEGYVDSPGGRVNSKSKSLE